MEPIKIFQGITGTAELYSDKIILKRTNNFLDIVTYGARGDKTIPFASITSIQVKKPDSFLAGYIQFGVLGGVESRGGIQDAVHDENTVVFGRDPKDLEDALFIKEYIENSKARSDNIGFGRSVADELVKLKDLLDKEIITQEEFDVQKRKILS